MSAFLHTLWDLASSLAAGLLVLQLAWIGWVLFLQPCCSHEEVRAKSWRVLRLVVPSYRDEMRHLRSFANLMLNCVSELRLGRKDGC